MTRICPRLNGFSFPSSRMSMCWRTPSDTFHVAVKWSVPWMKTPRKSEPKRRQVDCSTNSGISLLVVYNYRTRYLQNELPELYLPTSADGATYSPCCWASSPPRPAPLSSSTSHTSCSRCCGMTGGQWRASRTLQRTRRRSVHITSQQQWPNQAGSANWENAGE